MAIAKSRIQTDLNERKKLNTVEFMKVAVKQNALQRF